MNVWILVELSVVTEEAVQSAMGVCLHLHVLWRYVAFFSVYLGAHPPHMTFVLWIQFLCSLCYNLIFLNSNSKRQGGDGNLIPDSSTALFCFGTFMSRRLTVLSDFSDRFTDGKYQSSVYQLCIMSGRSQVGHRRPRLSWFRLLPCYSSVQRNKIGLILQIRSKPLPFLSHQNSFFFFFFYW